MAIRVAINHETESRNDRLVMLSPDTVRLHPAVYSRAPIHRCSFTLEPENRFMINDVESRRIAGIIDIGDTFGRFDALRGEVRREYPIK